MKLDEAEMIVILQTSERSAQAVILRLLDEEIEAHIVDRPNWIAEALAFGTYRFRVAVRREDEERARATLEAWRPEAEANVKQLAGGVQRDLLLAALPTVPTSLGYGFLLDTPFGWLSAALLLPFMWGGYFILIGRLRARRSKAS